MAIYDRDAAVAYAHKWAFSRNPAYYDYGNIGGDCANFASQVLLAGGSVMDYTPDLGWYYISPNDKAPAWTGVEYLYRFLIQTEKAAGPNGVLVKTLNQLEPGDLIQLSFDGENFTHTPIVVAAGETPETLLIAAHSYNSDYRPLSTYDYQAIRLIHITDIKEPAAELPSAPA